MIRLGCPQTSLFNSFWQNLADEGHPDCWWEGEIIASKSTAFLACQLLSWHVNCCRLQGWTLVRWKKTVQDVREPKKSIQNSVKTSLSEQISIVWKQIVLTRISSFQSLQINRKKYYQEKLLPQGQLNVLPQMEPDGWNAQSYCFVPSMQYCPTYTPNTQSTCEHCCAPFHTRPRKN